MFSISDVRPGVDISGASDVGIGGGPFQLDADHPQQLMVNALKMCPARGMEKTVEYQAACVQNQIFGYSAFAPNTFEIEKALKKCPNGGAVSAQAQCMFRSGGSSGSSGK